MKQKFIDFYMKIADAATDLSHGERLRVGAVIVKGDKILATGYNGMPNSWDNKCEHRSYMDRGAGGWLDYEEIIERWPFEEPGEDGPVRYKLVTNPEVLHAETNALMKIARSTESSEGATLFCTHSPCMECAKLIHQGGINSVYYRTQYRTTEGIEFLTKSGVTVKQV